MNQFYKNLALWLIIGLIMITLFNIFNKPMDSSHEIVYSDLVAAIENKDVPEVTIKGNYITGKLSNGTYFKTYAPEDPELIKIMRAQGIKINAAPQDENSFLTTIFISWFPMILLVGVWIFFMKQMQGGGVKGAFSFGKSKAKLISDKNVTTFKDVAGVEEAKEELQEIIEFLKEPQKFQKLGGKLPKGVLLMGPPGTGKTLLARAVAGEAGVPFFSISGSDFVEMFVGVGASRVRDLFEQGKKNAPCILFVDEIDAVGRHRGAGLGGGHDEREQTLNQLLVEMDGFESNEGVIMIAATNRPDVLDPALMRPGRFDRQVVVSRPDIKGRIGILNVHLKNVPVADNVSADVLARGTPGFSGADLASLVNEGSLLAARRSKQRVDMKDLEDAKDKVMMGAERKSMIISDDEKMNTAYHEAGHALVAKLIPGTDPIHKVSIIPRGRALGLTQQLPIDEKHTYAKQYLINNIAILMGGRAAEEIALKHKTTGAGNDIERATDIARKMVCEWGMSDKMGPLSFGKKEEQIFLGREISQHKDYSEATAVEIDAEIRLIVSENYDRVKNLLLRHLDILENMAKVLLEKEVLEGEEIDQIVSEGLKHESREIDYHKRNIKSVA